MPRYIIHIGPMKTGSTYLQRCIVDAADMLQAHGIYYPREIADDRHHVVHTPVLLAARNESLFDAMHAQFTRLNEAGHSTILLSNEFLAFLKPNAIARLRRMIGSDDVRIVYSCRRWSDRIPSMWFQSLFSGGTQTLPEFYAQLISTQTEEQDIDYTIVWRRWAEAFGRDALTIFPFSHIVDSGAGVFSRFCADILDLTGVEEPPAKGNKGWVSPPPPEIELLRTLNIIHQQSGGKLGSDMYWGIQGQRRGLGLAGVLAPMADATAKLALDDEAGHFAATAARLATYADRLAGDAAATADAMFPPRLRQAPFITQHYLLRPGVVATLLEFYQAILAAAPRAGKPAGGPRARAKSVGAEPAGGAGSA